MSDMSRHIIKLLAEGKTKRMWAVDGNPGQVIVESKDDITAGDGAKHDVMGGKAALSNQTNANVFSLLRECGLPVAFIEQIDEKQFLADKCDMIPLEVVVRREAHGSFLHRQPHLPKGHYFPRLKLEFFAKTNGKKWNGADILMDDPLLDLSGDSVDFYLPHWTKEQKEESEKIGTRGFLVGQRPFLRISRHDFLNTIKCDTGNLNYMGEVALKTFLILEKAWQILGRRMVDFKVEFGFDSERKLVLADVIDNDSWRLLDDGKYIDKQAYREGEDINAVTDKYKLVAQLTERFQLPKQQIILWRASESDNLEAFDKALEGYGLKEEVYGLSVTTCSLHKEPVRACEIINRLTQEFPDSVVIAYVGRSNGAGPTLSAQCTVPVITVPSTWKEFPEDVWSSLRTPSNTPVVTVLEPKNAVLAALQILAMRNPSIYAELRMRQEERQYNI